MSRQNWVSAYDTVEREHPDATDEELIALADEEYTDREAAKIDAIRERVKYEGWPDESE